MFLEYLKMDEILKDKLELAISFYFRNHQEGISQVLQNTFDGMLEQENLTYDDTLSVRQFENILATMQAKQASIIISAISSIVADVLTQSDEDLEEEDF